MPTLTVGRHYSFSTHSNPVIQGSFKNARLMSVMDYTTALTYSNIPLLHKQIYPYLPSNTLEDVTKYTFYLFIVNDRKIVIADVWILSGSVEETTGVDYTLKLQNLTTEQLNQIRDQLRLLGISFTIS